jgi:Family of unknown function (DUF5681)
MRGGRRSTSFKPGQSGNPNGRPKILKEAIKQADAEAVAQAKQIISDVKLAARELTQEAIETLKTAMSAVEAPMAARVNAAQIILDRGWGKPKETVDMTVRQTLEDLVLQSMRGKSEERRETLN